MGLLKKISLFTACIAAISVILVAAPDKFPVHAKTDTEIKSEIDALNSRMEKINKEQNDLKASINKGKANVNDLSGQISNLNHEIALIDEQVAVMESLLEQYTALIAEQEIKISDYEARIVKEQKMIDDMIRMSYEYGGVGSTVEFIFSAEDFSDMIMRIDLLGYHLSYNSKVLEGYSETLSGFEKTKQEYSEAKEIMDVYKTEQETLKIALEEKQNEAESKRAAIQMDVNAKQKEYDAKQAAINELNDEIKALANMLSKDDKTTYTGVFAFPLPDQASRITSWYGYRKDPFTGKTAYHNGYDFACPKGTKIYAADDGTVVLAKWNGGYGNCVTINHGGGVMSLYGHCSSLNVVAGQEVKRGDVIAYVGSTGRSTGNHLHFTVYKNGDLADPKDYLGNKIELYTY